MSVRGVRISMDYPCVYRRFIKKFNTIMTLMSKVIDATLFKYTPKAHAAFEVIKIKLIQASVLAL